VSPSALQRSLDQGYSSAVGTMRARAGLNAMSRRQAMRLLSASITDERNRSCSVVGKVDVLNVTLPETLHQPTRSAVGFRSRRQMNMVGHQDVQRGREPTRLPRESPAREKRAVIGLGKEDRSPVDTAQNSVQGVADGDDASVSGHADRSCRCYECFSLVRTLWSVPGCQLGTPNDAARAQRL